MYELLLKWGLDSLTKFSGTKGQHELSILLEAIKTKNTLIIERYKQTWALNEKLSDLIIELEVELDLFANESIETDGTWKSARQFIGKLKSDFHPAYYRKLVKLRVGFEGTNDILSAYTYTFLNIVNLDNLFTVCKSKKIYSRGEICRSYRGLWTKYGEVVSSIIRITSGDLRFWVTDIPYIQHADNWAEYDLQLLQRFISANNWGNNRLHISLESKRGLDKFWHELNEHHENNREQAKNKHDVK